MGDSNDNEPLDPREEGWRIAEPKPGFADRVMTGLRAQGAFAGADAERPPRARPVWALAAAFGAGAAVAAIATLLVVRAGSSAPASQSGGAVPALAVARVAIEIEGDSATVMVRAGQVLLETTGDEARLVKDGEHVRVHAPEASAPSPPTRQRDPRVPGASNDRVSDLGACYCPDDARPLEADQALLDQWADVCRVRADMPPLADASPEDLAALDLVADALDLAADERAQFRDASLAFSARSLGELQRIYSDATGDTSGVDEIDPEMLLTLIDRTAGPGEPARVRQRLARERAGRDEAPADMTKVSPYEELYRLLTALGDQFERELGERLGTDRARQLRQMHGGWPGTSFDWIGCP